MKRYNDCVKKGSLFVLARHLIILCALVLSASVLFSGCDAPQPCGISLTGLSQNTGYAGDTIELYSVWGATQGTKMPCINKGGMNELIVLSWSNSVIVAQIPAGLAPGDYRVGVYCNDPFPNGTYSSGWTDFTILEPSEPQPCGISLSGLSKYSGFAGDTIELYGVWGATQGTKMPCINMGGMNELIVLSWSNSVIVARIPAGLAPGDYRVGVYCNNPFPNGTYSSGWTDFTILPPR